jgi:hypothetical protein
MHTNIDDALAHLAAQPPHPGLAGLEGRILAVIEHQPAATIGAGATMAAVGLALALGVFSNIVPSTEAQASPTLSPFGAPSPLAPSTLLGGTR